MKELLRRLKLRPYLAIEIAVATFFINFLFLASPIYVIQILSRYIPYGFNATLITLTTGMLVALGLLLCFTVVRNRLSAAVSIGPDRQLAVNAMEALGRTRMRALNAVPRDKLSEIMSLPQAVQPAFDATRVNSVMDMPYCLLFLLAVFMLSPLLALVTLFAIAATVAAGWVSMNRARKMSMVMQEQSAAHRGLVTTALIGAETVRTFRGRSFLRQAYDEQVDRLALLRKQSGDDKAVSTSILQGVGGLLRVGVYALGAMQCVAGTLTVGALIGVSILAAKAMQIAQSYMQTRYMLTKADSQLAKLQEFFAFPLEPDGGTALKQYSGRLEFKDLGFMYPGAAGPLFESLNLALSPGGVAVVTGYNGSGKSTLAKLAVGLLEPMRGQIMVDGIDLRQLAPDWWRTQVTYVPQDPYFLSGTMRENILLANPGLDEAGLNAVVRAADLRKFLDAGQQGLETMIGDGGRSLPTGIRRRLALARALAVSGRLAVFDEPTEGMDLEGMQAVYAAMNAMAKQGVTMLVVSQDPNILKGAAIVVDLSEKPVPRIDRRNPSQECGG